MTIKFKILSIISMLCLAIVLAFVGVWALTDLDFIVGGNITYTAPKKEGLQQDEKGFYLAMGKYKGEDVIWRLVGLDGEKFTGSTAPTSGTGTFILDTFIEDEQVFGSSNDYATSDLRTYLTNEGESGFINRLNISANDAVYSKIKARDIQNLYINIGWAVDEGGLGGATVESQLPAGVILGTSYTIETTVMGEDKFWLMSVEEIFTLVGGGSLNLDGTIPDDWYEYSENLIWKENSTDDIGIEYWLRSPSVYYASSHIYEIYENGEWSYESHDLSLAVRPAFNLVF